MTTVPSREIAVIIPHLGLYGGNLRYIELGNALTARGVDFTIATPEGTRPDYLPYHGRTATLTELRRDPPRVLLASEQRIFDEFLAFPAERRFFYFILEKTAREKEIARSGVSLLANSSGLVRRLQRRYRVDARPVIGGVNASLFHPLAPKERELRRPGSFRVLAHGRFSRRRKGTRLVARAVDGLARHQPGMELSFFDSSTIDHQAGIPQDFRCRARVRLDRDLPRDKLRIVYGSSDLFVSAEKKAGWSNTTIEAMACGVPVVCTRSGTTDFAIHGETALVVPRTAWHLRRGIARVMSDAPLRERLAAAGIAMAHRFSWEGTATQLLAALGLPSTARE